MVVDAYRSADSKRHFLTVGGSRTYHRPRRYVLSRRFPTLDALFADRSAGTIIHPSKKALMQAIDNETYLGWWGDVVVFDANNTGAEIRNREARRLVSTSQAIADRWVTAVPDPTVPHSRPRSTITRTAAERRLGLFLTVSRAYYDGREEHGEHVSQSDRLGDTIINGDSKTGRHNKFNRACRDAIAAKSTTAVILGDKGDGRTGRRRRVRRRRRGTRGPTRTTCRTSSRSTRRTTATTCSMSPRSTRRSR